MRLIILQGHTRAITQVKFNREGDLIFSAAKDSSPNVCYSSNGERLGTFDGHKGAIWCIDVDWQTNYFLSGSGDMTICLWDCETGKLINKMEKESPVRTCSFGYSGNTFVYSTDNVMSKPCEIFVGDVRNPAERNNKAVPAITITDSKVTSLLPGPLDTTFITGHKNGSLRQWDTRTNKMISSVEDHHDSINDMQSSQDGTMFITASHDNNSKLFDSDTLTCLKTYKTERPVHSATISPDLKNVCLGGGPAVELVANQRGKFSAEFYDLKSENEFARVDGHFGPINCLAFNPSGTQFASGAEDGFIRIHTFDESY